MESKNEFIKMYCSGCGALLQNDDPLKVGFLPKRLEAKKSYLCQRCFRLQHYGESYEDIRYSIDFKNIIELAKKEGSLIVYVVDLFAFDCSIIQSIIDLIKDARVAVIASKRDVIPASVKDEKLVSFIRTRFEELGIKPLSIITSSAINNYNLDEIMESFNKLRNNKNVYVFGATSVGKSSLVNAFLRNYSNKTTQFISTSHFPGTTLDVIQVPIDDHTYIYDTPGILLDNSIFAHVDKKLMKYILPRKEIKPKVYQLQDKQSLMVENIAKIDLIEGTKTNMIVYMSNDLSITRSKYVNSERVFNNMIKNKQFKLLDRNINCLNDLEAHDLVLPNRDCDLVISGLLWIKIKGKGQKVCVWAHKGVDVVIRECKI